MKTKILSRADLEPILTMELAVPAIEGAFAAHGRGEASMPPKVYLDVPEFGGDFRAMPARLGNAAGIKWVNSHPNNPRDHKLPAVMGVFILSNPATATPLAIMDATLLTAVRTGAAGAVASKHLAVSSPRTLGFVGCGVQARVLLAAHREVYGDGLELRMADADGERAEVFASESGGSAVSLEQAAACDIVCTTTPSRKPVLQRSWIPSGCHINAIGADAEGKQELDPAILGAATVVIDEYEQASHSGEINVPLQSGKFNKSQIHGTLGEVVAGMKPGRRGDEITVFDSTGLAVQDVALAAIAFERAADRGVGINVELV